MSPETTHRSRPVLLVVDQDDEARARVEHELGRRFGIDYDVVVCSSSASARDRLGELKARGAEVAVVLADHALSGVTAGELLTEVNELYPIAKRALLIEWGAWADPATAEALHSAIALGHSDYEAWLCHACLFLPRALPFTFRARLVTMGGAPH